MASSEGDWKHLRGRIRERWNLLTEKDLAEITGRDILEIKLQKLYGWDKSHVDNEINRFESTLSQGKNITRNSGKNRYFPDQR